MHDAWNDIREEIGRELPKNTFSLWINPITFMEFSDGAMVLACPNRFSRDWVTENYLPLIREKAARRAGSHVDVVLKVQPLRKQPPDQAEAAPSQLVFPVIAPAWHAEGNGLNGNYTFDRFIVGQSNEFAYSASKALAGGSRCDYDTLLMLAGTGLGKTHLAHAVGHLALQNNPKIRVRYLTAEDFTNQMIASIKSNRIDEFKAKYRRSCDVLLLEEIHFLSGKEKTQQELEYTLDALISDRKKVIFTSAIPPKDIPRISTALSSRLLSGLVTTISEPDYETRALILARKAEEFGLALSDDIIHLLAGRLKHDVRQMESALKCLKAKSHLINAKIGKTLAEEVIGSLAESECAVTPHDIRELVCTYYKIEPEMLESRSRKKVFASPRNVYVYLCRRHTDQTLSDIGKTINRSHSSVLYASELVEHKMKTEDRFRRQVHFLDQKLDEMKHAV